MASEAKKKRAEQLPAQLTADEMMQTLKKEKSGGSRRIVVEGS
jgi:hypothetical protein